MTRTPNILIILTDQQAATALSCAGNPCVQTPNMDRLAATGVRFERAYCADPVCVPSRTAMFYGRMPCEVFLPGTDIDMAAKKGDPNRGVKPEFRGQELGKVLRAAGYDCAYAGKWHVGQWGPTESLEPGDDSGFRVLSPFHDQHVVPACAGYLAERRDAEGPFFLVASFENPHNIHEWATGKPLPSGELPDAPGPDEWPPLPSNFSVPEPEPEPVRRWRQSREKIAAMTAADWRRFRWTYFRLVEKVDGEIGRLLEALNASGMADNTLIIFTADHGDQHGAHGLAFKGVLYEESVRVPFICSGAGVEDPGRVSPRLVHNALDLYATACAAARVEVPPGTRGLNLLPELGNRAASVDRPYLVAECCTTWEPTRARMVRTPAFKYIIYESGANPEQLFDLDTDPGEMSNLAVCGRYGDVLQTHREHLREWMELTGDTFNAAHYTHPDTRTVLPRDAHDA